MRYVGGKARTASRIAQVIADRRGERSAYIEPFMGAASVSAAVAPTFGDVQLADAHADVAALWAAVRDGWQPPEWVTKDEYDALRSAQPSALRAFAGFACSYNGKWFGGYGPEAKSAGRNYVDEARRAILKKAPALAGADIAHADYRDFAPDADTVVYCDPPYAGTLGYAGTAPFDHVAFWRTVTTWAGRGAVVLVSEYTAPAGWVAAVEFDRTATVHHASSPPKRREGLFEFVGEGV